MDLLLAGRFPVLFSSALDVIEELFVGGALVQVVVFALVGHFGQLLPNLRWLEVGRVLSELDGALSNGLLGWRDQHRGHWVFHRGHCGTKMGLAVGVELQEG